MPCNISTIETAEDPDKIDGVDTNAILTGAEFDYEKEINSFLLLSTNDNVESDAIKTVLRGCLCFFRPLSIFVQK